MNDSHCHLFSRRFFASLGRAVAGSNPETAEETVLQRLGWESPGTAEELSDRWAAELDRHGVGRAALIASVPGDTESAARAVKRHPGRFVGFFMVDPTAPPSSPSTIQANFGEPRQSVRDGGSGAAAEAAAAIDDGGLRTICLFPALHRYGLQDQTVRALFEVAAARPGTAVFVHCGVLSIGVRQKLGLPNVFDPRLANPLDLLPLAAAFPSVPIIVPHFGAGFFREALMVADSCRNVVLDTSSSNAWIRYYPGLTMRAVLEQALAVAGPERLIFGSDSSFFPRGWVREVYEKQTAALDEIGVSAAVKEQIFDRNFERLFPKTR
jgi:hypothetical protein